MAARFLGESAGFERATRARIRWIGSGHEVLTLLVTILLLWVLAKPSEAGGLPLADDDGLPSFRHFEPREIGGGPQVLSLLELPDGRMAVASNRSVLDYDGNRWRSLRFDSPPRQLGLDSEGRLWVGCHDDFGWVETSGFELSYQSQKAALEDDARQLGRSIALLVLGDTLHLIFERRWVRWSREAGLSSEPWPEGATAAAATADAGELWVALSGRGLLHLPDRASRSSSVAERTVDEGSRLGERVQGLLALGPGRVLVGTQGGQTRVWRAGPAGSESSGGTWDGVLRQVEEALEGRAVRSLLRLADGGIALGTEGDGLWILDAGGRARRHYPGTEGPPTAVVYAMHETRSGSLWLGTASGVVRLDGTPLTHFGVGPGAPSSLVSLTRHRGELVLGALEGAFRLRPSEDRRPARFERIPGLSGVVTTWASTPGGLFAGSSQGLHRLVTTDAPSSTTELWLPGESAVAWNPAGRRLVVAGAAEVRSYHYDDGDWRSDASPASLPERIFEIVPEGPGVYWLTTFGNRVLYRLTLEGGSQSEPELTPFETSAPYPQFLRLAEGLRIRDHDRVLQPDPSAPIEAWPEDPRFDLAAWRPAGEDRFKLHATAEGALWIMQRDRLWPLASAEGVGYQPSTPRLGLPVDLNFDAHPDPSHPSVFWLATDRGPVRLDTAGLESVTAEPAIRFVPPRSDDGVAEVDPSRLEHTAGTYRFECSLPVLWAEEQNEFRYRLLGLSDHWSEWTAEPWKEYTNLWSGRYRFEVEARHAGTPAGEAGFDFRVVAPWYWSWPIGVLIVAMGLLLGVVLIARQRRRLARERLIADRERGISRRLRAVDRLKDEVLLETSLGLRGPLSGIASLAESLSDGAKGDLPSEVREDLQMIAASGRRLGVLVDDVLDLSKLRDQSLELDRRPVDLHPLVDVVLTVLRPTVGAKRVDLLNRVDPELPTVVADEGRLQQVLTNLVSNAIRFTESGSVVVSSAVLVEELVRLSVSDTGVGIQTDRHERIFRSFEESEGSPEAGVGLGLALSRRLVELHGGSLTVESEVGEGATFHLDLPNGPAEDRAQAKGESRVSEALARAKAPSASIVEPVEPPPPDPGSATFRVLIADDEPVNRQILINILSQGPYVLDVTTSGEEALAHLGAQRPDIALLDIMMPRISGYEVCRAIREDYPRFELPVLFLTAKSQPADLVAGYRAGANDYLVKPINKDELLTRVETHLELLRVHRHLERLVEQRTAQLKVLRGLLPLCSMCKKIRDDEGYWREVVDYINVHTEAEFSHGICPSCLDEHYEFLTGTPRPD